MKLTFAPGDRICLRPEHREGIQERHWTALFIGEAKGNGGMRDQSVGRIRVQSIGVKNIRHSVARIWQLAEHGEKG